jgi:hypothetical protein
VANSSAVAPAVLDAFLRELAFLAVMLDAVESSAVGSPATR